MGPTPSDPEPVGNEDTSGQPADEDQEVFAVADDESGEQLLPTDQITAEDETATESHAAAALAAADDDGDVVDVFAEHAAASDAQDEELGGVAVTNRMMQKALGDSASAVPASVLQNLRKRLRAYIEEIQADGFGSAFLIESIARVLERTAPPQGSAEVDSIAKRFEAAQRLRRLSVRDRREALSFAVQQLKVLVRDIIQLRGRVALLEETSTNACSNLNQTEHDLVDIQASYTRLLDLLADHVDADTERREAMADMQRSTTERLAVAQNMLDGLEEKGAASARADSTEVDALKSDLAAAEQAADAAKAEALGLREDLEASAQQESLVAQLRNDLDASEQRCEELLASAGAAEELESLRRDLAEAEAKLREQEVVGQDQDLGLQDMQMEMDGLEERLGESQSNLEQVQEDKAELEREHKLTVAELDRLREDLGIAEEQLSASQYDSAQFKAMGDADGLRAEVAMLEDRLASAQAECEQLRQAPVADSPSSHDDELQSLHERISELEATNSRYAEQLAAHDTERITSDTDEAELTALRQAATNAAEAQAELEGRLDAARSERDQLKESVRELQHARDLLAEELADLADRNSEGQEADNEDHRVNALVVAEQRLADERHKWDQEREELVAEFEREKQRLEARLVSVADQETALERRREETRSFTRTTAKQLAEMEERVGQLQDELSRSRDETDEMQAALREQLDTVEDARLDADRNFEAERLQWQEREQDLLAQLAEHEVADQHSEAGDHLLGHALGDVLNAAITSCQDGAGHQHFDDQVRQSFARMLADLEAAKAVLTDASADGDLSVWQETLGILQQHSPEIGRLFSEQARRHAEAAVTATQSSDALETRLADLVQQQAELETLCEAERRSGEEHAADCQQLQRQRDDLQGQLSHMQEARDELQQGYDVLSAEAEQLQRDVDRLRDDCENISQQRREFESMASTAEAALLASQESAEVASSCVTDLLASLRIVAKRLVASSDEDERRKRKDLSNHIIACKDLQKQLNQLPNKDLAANWPNALIADLQSLCVRVVDTLADERRQLRDAHNDMGSRFQTQQAELTDLQADYAELHDHCQDTESRVSSLEADSTTMRQERDQLLQSKQEQADALMQLRSELAGQQVDAQAMQQAMAARDDELQRLREADSALVQLRDDHESLQAQYQSVSLLAEELIQSVRQCHDDALALMGSANILTDAASRRLSRTTQRVGRLAREGQSEEALRQASLLCQQIGQQVDHLHAAVMAGYEQQAKVDASLQDLEQRNEELDDQCHTLQQQIDERSAACRASEEKLAATRLQLAQVQDEESQQRLFVSDIKKQIEREQKQWQSDSAAQQARAEELLEAMQEERDAAKATAAELEADVIALREAQEQAVVDAEANAAEFAAQKQDWSNLIRDAEQRAERLQGELDGLRREHVEIRGLRSRISTLDQKLHDANREVARLRQALGDAERHGSDGTQHEQALREVRLERDDLQRQLGRLERRLAQEQTRCSSLERSHEQHLEHWQQRLTEQQMRNRESQGEVDRQQEDLRQLRRDLAGLRARLKSVEPVEG